MSEKRYIKFSEELLDRIAAGEWQLGDALPPEVDLAQGSGLSRSTVRLALARLEKLGMVSRKRKRGTVLIALSPQRILERQIGSLEQLDEFAERTKLHILEFYPRTGDELSKLHKINMKLVDHWIEYLGWRSWLDDPTPVSCTRFAFDGLYEGAKTLMGKSGKPSFKVIEDSFRLNIASIDQSIRAIATPSDVAEILQIPEGAPALEVKRLMFLEDGRPVIHAHSIHRADAVQMKTRMQLNKS